MELSLSSSLGSKETSSLFESVQALNCTVSEAHANMLAMSWQCLKYNVFVKHGQIIFYFLKSVTII